MSPKTKEAVTPEYDSNPFTLAFNAFSRFFKTNLGWAIAVLALAFLSFIGQLLNNLLQLAFTPESSSTSTSTSANDLSLGAGSSDTNVAAVIMIVFGVLLIVALVIIVASAVSTFISGMLSYVAVQSEKGKKVSFSEAFEATTKRFWRLYFAGLLAGLKIFAWSLLLIIPGIIAAFRYKLLPYVIMNDSETKGVKSSHDEAKMLVKGRLMEVFGVATVSSIIPFVGSLIGLTGNAALYSQLKVYNDAKLEKPKIHWLNYLGFMLLGLVLLFVFLIVLIIAAAAVSSS